MSDAPLVSIVLPTYNGARYLAGAIASVRRQTYPHWELLLIDSASTDATPAIIAQAVAQDSRIRSAQHPKEAGRLPGALNAGFALARGQYHTWLADDNEFVPQALARLVAYLEAHPAIVLVYSHFHVTYDDGQTVRLFKRLPPDYLPTKNIITPSFLYRAALHPAIGGYRTDYFTAEDYDFYLRARDHGAFALIEEPLHLYRFHTANLTAQYAGSYQDEVVERLLLDNLAHCRWLQAARPRALVYAQLAELAQKHQRPTAARRYHWQAFRCDPALVLRRWLVNRIPAGLRAAVSARYRRARGLE